VGVLARWVVPFLTVVGVTLAAAPLQTGPAPGVRLVDSGNPIAGHNLYVDPTSAAMAAAHRANPPSAELDAIANTPQAFWIDGAVPSAAIGRYVNEATAAGAMPVLAVYALPHRDCGSFAAGGFGSG
jgi:endoglucanase